jgi:pimeloyl-ACP methyl ester carboxylesterase
MIVRLPGRGGLEVDDRGAGVPMIVIQTALDADELRPLAAALAEAGPYRVVHYLRRGYGGSAALTRPTTIADEVADLEALCRALSLGPVHLIGASFSAAVALSAASASPDTVLTLTVMEPPPLGVPSESEFIAACQRLLDARRRDGPQRALDDFMPLIAGPGWRVDMERERPGAAAALERDAATFFDSDMPALLAWRFSAGDAARIRCPVLHVGAAESGPWFAEVRARLTRLLPGMDSVVIPGAGHTLAATHTRAVTRAVLDFLRRHPD